MTHVSSSRSHRGRDNTPDPAPYTLRAICEDVPEAVRLVIGDIAARPQSHALVAIVAFNLPLLALLIGAWWVGVFQ